MAQIAEIIMAILGLCNVVSIKAVCIVILCCEVIRTICDACLKRLRNNRFK